MTFLKAGLRVTVFGALMMAVAACSSTPDEGGASTSTPSTSTSSSSSVTPGSQQDLVVNVGDRVFFALDRSDLDPEARSTLQRQSAWLKQHPSVTITVEGHADERGTREYNLALGARRANAVKDFLVAQGVDPARVSTISYGKERPVALCSDESCWSQNRRGVTVVTGGASS